MLVTLLIAWAVVAVAFGITSWILPGMEMSGGVVGYLWVALLFGIVNAVIGTILRLLTLPLKVVTLGLISVVVNAILINITDGLSDHLEIDEFWWTAIWASIILAVVTVVLEIVVSRLRPGPRSAGSAGAAPASP